MSPNINDHVSPSSTEEIRCEMNTSRSSPDPRTVETTICHSSVSQSRIRRQASNSSHQRTDDTHDETNNNWSEGMTEREKKVLKELQNELRNAMEEENKVDENFLNLTHLKVYSNYDWT